MTGLCVCGCAREHHTGPAGQCRLCKLLCESFEQDETCDVCGGELAVVGVQHELRTCLRRLAERVKKLEAKR